MENIFITNIHIDKVRNLENFDIGLSQTEKKHLILTGKNGSGKTSLLEELKNLLSSGIISFNENLSFKFDQPINVREWWSTHNVLAVKFNSNKFSESIFALPFAYISAKRDLNMEVPKSIEKINIDGKNKFEMRNKNLSRDFLKYIVYLDYQRLRARADEDKQRLEKWFDRFELALKKIYNCPELELEPMPDDLLFRVKIPNYEPFGLNEMSDGYSAFLNIIIELILRMDNGNAVVNTDLPGIVLIDEIETHLHIELQKKIFPFLIEMFPNIQFIVSTHSPFVISSISDAIIYDLEKKLRVEDLSGYSYEGIIENYYGKDMYSDKAKNMFDEYKKLYGKYEKKELKEEETNRFADIIFELNSIPPSASKELIHEFLQMEKARKLKKDV